MNIIVMLLPHVFNKVEALDTFDNLARKLYDKSLPEEEVKKIKLEMSHALNLMNSNRHETLAEASRLYETVRLNLVCTNRRSTRHLTISTIPSPFQKRTYRIRHPQLTSYQPHQPMTSTNSTTKKPQTGNLKPLKTKTQYRHPI